MKKITFAFAALMLVAVSCAKTDPQQGGKQPGKPQEPEEPQAAITIDGKFDDWADLKDAYVAKNDPESQWEAVKELRVYATGDQIFYYVRYDKEVIVEYLQGNDTFPARVNLNTDGEFTSGYSSYFTQSYDFIIEMSLGNGAGGWDTAEGSFLYQRIDGKWVELLGENSGLTFGAGSGYEYELVVDRAIFNRAASASTIPMPMGDNFQTSMRFYETSSTGSWEELSNIPNSSEGYGPLIDVTFAK